MEIGKARSATRISAGAFLLFIIYINDLLSGIEHISDDVLFADDTSVLVADKSYEKFKQKWISVMSHLENQFDGNQLVLNNAKMNFMRFTPANFACVPLTIQYKNILIKDVTTTKFLGMHIDTNMNWKKHRAYPSKIGFCMLCNKDII
jgi:hypothetical protein